MLYPGNKTSKKCLHPTVRDVERLLKLTKDQRKRTIFRTDGGFGTDANINWILRRGYQILTKGYSGKRANAFAKMITHWDEVSSGKWIAPAVNPIKYSRKTKTIVVRFKSEKGKIKHCLIISSLLSFTSLEQVDFYDDRAAIEIEIKADKGSLNLPKRRKRNLYAQEALVLLTDLAHNIVGWTRPIWANEPYLNGGTEFIMKKIFEIPGKAMFDENELIKLRLKASHPFAKPVLKCLEHLLEEFSNP